MSKENKRTARHSHSIARGLNLALIRRGFFRMLVLDIIFFLVIGVMWCAITESYYGGGQGLFSKRDFTNLAASVCDNTANLITGDKTVSVSESRAPILGSDIRESAYSDLHSESVTFR